MAEISLNQAPKTTPGGIPILRPGVSQPSRGMCIYGKSGVGKTTLLRTLPGRGLLIDVPQLEGGTEVLAGVNTIEILHISEWSQLDDVETYVKQNMHTANNLEGYRWVAIDSITALQTLAKRKVVKERPISSDPHQMTLQEFGKIKSLLEEVIYRFRTLPIFTVWIAQERKFSNDDEPTTYGPDVLPSALNVLMPSLFLVGRYRPVTTLSGAYERHLQIAPSADTHAKFRARPDLVVPHTIRNPNISLLIQYLAGRKTDTKGVPIVLEAVTDSGMLTID